MTHGKQMNIDNTAVVGLRPAPHLVVGDLTQRDASVVFAWVALNIDALIDYWNGQIDTIQLGQQLRRVE